MVKPEEPKPAEPVVAQILEEEEDFDEFEDNVVEQDASMQEDKLWTTNWEDNTWGEEDADDSFQKELKAQVLAAQTRK